MTSINLAREFYGETSDYEGLVSRERKIFLCKMHNYQKEWNRIVSWGSIKPINLDDGMFDLYRVNLMNDFYLSPSIIAKSSIGNTIISPHRWFYIFSKSNIEFEAIVNYNFGVIYLEKEKLSKNNIRKKKIWLNDVIELYEVEGYFVIFHPSEFVKIRRVLLHFIEDPNNITIDGKGEFFITSVISFNNYTTNYRHSDIKKGNNINVVESGSLKPLISLTQNPYLILLFFFPYVIDSNVLDRLVYRFSIKKDVFKTILSRINKTSDQQDENKQVQNNKLLKVAENGNYYDVEIINPAVIPYLVKNIKNTMVNREVLRLLREQNILDKIKRLEELMTKNMRLLSNLELCAFFGIQQILSLRKTIFEKYIQIARNPNFN